jgi:LmbE family N-acetylglucosaminyl deacetylase
VLVLGAHPDDAEVFAGGLIIRHCRLDSVVRIVSVTDGSSGHYRIPPQELKNIRRSEAKAAGELVGAEYVTWDFRDGRLQATLEVREAIIREIRNFRPDLVLTHRPCDYHPDHRAVGQAVQDASYMVTVPLVCDDTPHLEQDPVVAYMCDLFTRPYPFKPDVLLDVEAEFEENVQMAACHRSQFFEWLPYHDGKLAAVPSGDAERLAWLAEQLSDFHRLRARHFSAACSARNFDCTATTKLEAYEVSEYAGGLHSRLAERLFPGGSIDMPTR